MCVLTFEFLDLTSLAQRSSFLWREFVVVLISRGRILLVLVTDGDELYSLYSQIRSETSSAYIHCDIISNDATERFISQGQSEESVFHHDPVMFLSGSSPSSSLSLSLSLSHLSLSLCSSDNYHMLLFLCNLSFKSQGEPTGLLEASSPPGPVVTLVYSELPFNSSHSLCKRMRAKHQVTGFLRGDACVDELSNFSLCRK